MNDLIGKDLLRYNKDKLFVFFDYETFNLTLSFINNLPWQLGILKVKGEKILDSRDLLIKWKTKLKISDDAARITHYSQEKMDRYGIPQEEAFAQMYDWFMESDYLIGHNICNFDVYLLKDWCILMKKPWKQFIPKMIDTNAIAKGIGLGIPYHPGENFLEYQYKCLNEIKKGLKTNMTDLGKKLGIDVNYSELHNSYNDILLNKIIWDKLKFSIEI